ncbi:zinc finger, C2H2 type [Ancylostoma caninum]|uniref:Zinc finger, C2H2 type n=1 Tax=Ancylostoma caninum TaxID=29170 RepID=A0A368F4A3_ANCCA|nr:zinc finger, C2H2 type [Ancylostoma caninum]
MLLSPNLVGNYFHVLHRFRKSSHVQFQAYSTDTKENIDDVVINFGIRTEETKEGQEAEFHEESWFDSTVARSQSPSHRRRRRKSHNFTCSNCDADFIEEEALSLSDFEELPEKSSKTRKRKSRYSGASSSPKKCEKQECDSKRPKKDTSCPFCGRVFATMQTRKRHIVRSHPDKMNDEAVNLHMYKGQPSKELPFVCTKCHKTFSNVSSLNMHRKSIHEGIKNHVCRVCKKAYPRGCDLRKHVKRVHEKNLLLPHTVVF